MSSTAELNRICIPFHNNTERFDIITVAVHRMIGFYQKKKKRFEYTHSGKMARNSRYAEYRVQTDRLE